MVSLKELRDAFRRCHCDVLAYTASATEQTPLRKLVYKRFELLGQEIGQDLDMAKVQRQRQEHRERSYELFLQREYNISRQQAAELMDKALKAESSKYNASRRKR